MTMTGDRMLPVLEIETTIARALLDFLKDKGLRPTVFDTEPDPGVLRRFPSLALRTPVDRANQRFGNVCRISAKLLPKPSQPASPPLLTIVNTKRRGKYG